MKERGEKGRGAEKNIFLNKNNQRNLEKNVVEEKAKIRKQLKRSKKNKSKFVSQ